MIILNGNSNLKQWDLQKSIVIIPRGGETVQDVAFYKGREPQVVTHRTSAGKILATIPNFMLKSYGVITSVVDYIDENGFVRREHANFVVSKRKKPDGYSDEIFDDSMGSVDSPSGGGSSDAVQYIPQELTEEQQMQARKNLGVYYAGSVAESEFLPKGTYAFSESGGYYAAMLPSAELNGNASYVVTLDGAEYVCEVKTDPNGVNYLGNSIFEGSNDTGEPFFAFYDVAGLAFVTSSAEEEHEITIIERKQHIAQVGMQYIPIEKVVDAVNAKLGITYVELPEKVNGQTYEKYSGSFDDLISACRNGLVIGKHSGRTYIATQNARNGNWYVDFYRYESESAKNSGAPGIHVIAIASNGDVTDIAYNLN